LELCRELREDTEYLVKLLSHTVWDSLHLF
jgi:hypothetical protein